MSEESDESELNIAISGCFPVSLLAEVDSKSTRISGCCCRDYIMQLVNRSSWVIGLASIDVLIGFEITIAENTIAVDAIRVVCFL
jgi:hypothetical protein